MQNDLLRIAKPGARAATRYVAFTERRARELPAAQRRQCAYYDSKVRGLMLLVTNTGTKSWYRYGRINGKVERVYIGTLDAVRVEQARRAAQALNGEVAVGKNPAAQRRATLGELTFSALFQKYIELHARPRKRSWASDEAQYRRYLKPWSNRRVSSIRTQDIAKLHAELGAAGHPTGANRALALLGTVFSFARKTLKLTIENPARGIARFPEESRERHLSPPEMERLLHALDTEPNEDLADLVRLLLFTGARRGNALSARWESIDWETGTWTVAGSESKNRHPMAIPLTPEVVAILRRRRQAQASQPSEWLFPSRSSTGHMVEPKPAWHLLRERAGLRDFRLHDLRRSVGSWLTGLGASATLVGKLLGHRPGSTATAVYARLDLSAVRTALDAAVSGMLATARPKKSRRQHGTK